MSNVTEVKLGILLRKDIPKEVLDLIQNCLHRFETPVGDLPDHEFFHKERWFGMFANMECERFDRPSLIKLKGMGNHYLILSAGISNESGEVEQFVDWISQYAHPLPTDNFTQGKENYIGSCISGDTDRLEPLYLKE